MTIWRRLNTVVCTFAMSSWAMLVFQSDAHARLACEKTKGDKREAGKSHRLVKYAYTQFPPGTDEKAALNAMVRQAEKEGLLFLSDNDASRRRGLHPLATRHDNGPDPLADLRHRLRVRDIAMRNFGPGNLSSGQPLALLRKRFLKVYFYHSYQARSVAKLIGGMTYRHRLSGKPDRMKMVDARRQRAAIKSLVALTEPSFLDIPDRILGHFPPRTIGYWPEEGAPRDNTGRSFDALGVAAKAAGSIFNALLSPARVSRLVEMSRRSTEVPSLDTLLNALTNSVFQKSSEPERFGEIRRAIQKSLVRKLQKLALDKNVSESARARVDIHLWGLRDRLMADGNNHATWLADQIRRQLERPFGSDKHMAARERRGRPSNDNVDTDDDLWDNEPSVIFSGSAISWSD